MPKHLDEGRDSDWWDRFLLRRGGHPPGLLRGERKCKGSRKVQDALSWARRRAPLRRSRRREVQRTKV